jgi:hypothetical protein
MIDQSDLLAKAKLLPKVMEALKVIGGYVHDRSNGDMIHVMSPIYINIRNLNTFHQEGKMEVSVFRYSVEVADSASTEHIDFTSFIALALGTRCYEVFSGIKYFIYKDTASALKLDIYTIIEAGIEVVKEAFEECIKGMNPQSMEYIDAADDFEFEYHYEPNYTPDKTVNYL